MRIKQFCITVVLVSLLALNLRAESSESSESPISDDSPTTAGVTESNKNDTVKEVGDLKSPSNDSEGEKKLWKSKLKDGNFKQPEKEESWRAKSGRDDERRRRYRDDRDYDSDFRDDDRDWRYERPCRVPDGRRPPRFADEGDYDPRRWHRYQRGRYERRRWRFDDYFDDEDGEDDDFWRRGRGCRRGPPPPPPPPPPPRRRRYRGREW
ncbi:hypothetical protein Aperf_G00000005141 [Anoplocephala perfoliata]